VFCNRTYQVIQVEINGVDVIQRIAELATKGAILDSAPGREVAEGICEDLATDPSSTLHITEVSTYTDFYGIAPNRPVYVIQVSALGFVVDPLSNLIYEMSDSMPA
jgi:hypothetical protein